MAHRTFFSFHYERDVWRASVVRKSSFLQDTVDAEWIEAGIWEDAKATSDAAVQALILGGLTSTSVTAVLIGSETASRRWVNYEIERSIERKNGLLGIYIHNIRDSNQNTDSRGANPLPLRYSTYDWVNDDGYNNLGAWVTAAHDGR